MKRIKRVIIIFCVVFFCGASTAYAANTFVFSFAFCLQGKTEFDLKNLNTICKSKASTYIYGTNDKANFVGHYCIELDGNGFFNPNYRGQYKAADGYEYKTNYYTIKKNTYTINMGTNDDLIPCGGIIKGSGNIIQNR